MSIFDKLSLNEIKVIQKALNCYTNEHDTFMEQSEQIIVNYLLDKCKEGLDTSPCCCEGKGWNCSDLPECVDQEEWNSLYLVPRCSK